MSTGGDPDKTRFGPEAAAERLPAGFRIGSLEIEEYLGGGGMGDVYAVRHVDLDQRFAVKLIKREIAERAEVQERFRREARVMARLRHPGIVRVDDFGILDGRPWLRMELVAGRETGDGAFRSLEAWIQARKRKPLPEAEVRAILDGILDALSHAHGEGLVHRDIKPANILLTPDGIRVADFGLVSVAGTDWLESRIQLSVYQSRVVADPDLTRVQPDDQGTSTQAFLGTWDYMAPEQKRREPATARSDLYAVGLIAWRLLTGRESLGMDRPSEIVKGLDPDWDEWFRWALADDPDDRFVDAEEMRSCVPSNVSIARGPNPEGRRGLPVFVVVMFVLLVVGGIFAWQLRSKSHPKPQSSTPTVAIAENEPGQIASTPVTPSMSPAEVFTLRLLPNDVEARVWIGPHSNVLVETGEAKFPDLPPGRHRLRVEATGYQSYNEIVTVAEDEFGEFDVELVPMMGRLEIRSDPGTTVVAVNAKDRNIALGATGANGVLKVVDVLHAGVYEFRLTKPRHRTVVERGVELLPTREVELTIDLEPLPASLDVFSLPRRAEILLRGHVVGETPTRIDLPAEQELVIEIRKDGFRTEQRTFTLSAMEVAEWDVGELVEATGDLSVTLVGLETDELRDVAVTVDGLSVSGRGASWTKEDLDLGEVVINVEHPQYEAWSGRTAIMDGETSQVSVELRPKPGVLALQVFPADAEGLELTANGQTVKLSSGMTAELPAKRELALELSAPGYVTATRSLRLATNGRETWRVALEKQPGPQEGRDWTVPELDMEFVWIAAMGTWVGKYEVTNAEFRRFRREHDSGDFHGRSLNRDRQPVVEVSYEDAEAFCAWLTQRERDAGRLPAGLRYRLPDGDEWTRLARFGDSREYPWGDRWPPPRGSGNYADETTKRAFSNWTIISGYDDGHAVTAPVESSGRNDWGLHGVGGNVWEWTSEISGSSRVLRGASWNNNHQDYLRVENRNSIPPSYRDRYVGFRILLSR